jgi:hypothetical protein
VLCVVDAAATSNAVRFTRRNSTTAFRYSVTCKRQADDGVPKQSALGGIDERSGVGRT